MGLVQILEEDVYIKKQLTVKHIKEGKLRLKCAAYRGQLFQLGLRLGLRLEVAIGALVALGEDQRAARAWPQLDTQQRRR